MKTNESVRLPDAAVLEALVGGVDEAVIVYSTDFSISLFNARAEDMFGVTAFSVIGKAFTLDVAQGKGFEVLMPVMYSSLAPTLVRLSEAGANPEKVRITLDDPVREFSVVTYILLAGGFVKIVRETTREGALVKSKSDFVTVAAHQLRTPATAVNWTFESLEKDASLGGDARESVRVGHLAAQNMLAVITRLLDAVQMEDGKFGYAVSRTDLVVFLDSLLASAIPVARQYDVSVYFERPKESSVFVSVDAAKFGAAMANIVDNAVKYNSKGGQVIVGLSIEMGNAHVTVTDTGIGIAEIDIPKIFSKFFRGEGIVAKSTEGSGLGLYLAKNIIEGHKGKLWVESALGRGSTFHITLPLAD